MSLAEELTCARVDELNLDTRYLAGSLPPAEAEAFEAHYFACTRCWALVKGGLEVGAALAAPAAAPARAPSARPRGLLALRPLLAAAALAAVAFGTWRLAREPAPLVPADSLRSPELEPAAVTVRLVPQQTGIAAAWTRTAGAEAWLARVLTADGRLVLERELTDTALVLAGDSLRAALGAGTGFIEIQALDAFRRPLGRSPPAPLPASGR